MSFKAAFQKGGRIQIPRLIRWQFKMEPEQVLKVTVGDHPYQENFYARMSKDGRITIPKILLKDQEEEENPMIVGEIITVYLEPADQGPSKTRLRRSSEDQ